MWTDEEKVGKRLLQKQRCLDMNWCNSKEITIWELARCINQYNIDINHVPEEKLASVKKEITKLIKQEKELKNRKRIERILLDDEPNEELCKLLNNPGSNSNSKFANSYLFSPELFANEKSAKDAIILVDDLVASIINSILHDGQRFKDSKFSKDIANARSATLKLMKAYEKLGIHKSKTSDALKAIKWELPITIKKHLISKRETITEHFIKLGNKKTNAEKIANAITILTEQHIYTTSKF